MGMSPLPKRKKKRIMKLYRRSSTIVFVRKSNYESPDNYQRAFLAQSRAEETGCSSCEGRESLTRRLPSDGNIFDQQPDAREGRWKA